MDPDEQFGQIALAHDLITDDEHDDAWRALKKLRKSAKGKRKKGKGPRLVDVLVQRKIITGREARSVENARLYRQARMEDKLFARVVLKSGFCKQKQVEKGLEHQRSEYLEGDLVRLSDYLRKKKILTSDQVRAIKEAIEKLDVEEYVGGKKGKGKKGKGKKGKKSSSSDFDDSDDLGSGSEIDSGVEELGGDSDEGVEELDLTSDSGSGSALSLDDAASVDDLDSQIDDALSGIDIDSDSSASTDPPPRGLSSDDLGSDDFGSDDLDGSDDLGDLSDDLGSGIELDSEEVAAASGRAPKVGAGKKGKGKGKAPAKKSKFKAPAKKSKFKAPAKKGKKAKKAESEDLDDLDDSLDLDDLGSDLDFDSEDD